MRITDDTDATFEEDMAYIGMIRERIFRTAITNNLDLEDNGHSLYDETLGDFGPKEMEMILNTLDDPPRITIHVNNGNGNGVPKRGSDGRFVKQDA